MGLSVRQLLRRKGTPYDALEILPNPDIGPFRKEDGEVVQGPPHKG
jgi:hypothetical protein